MLDDTQKIAYERFTQDGPVAMLPIGKQRYSVVWSMTNDQMQEIELFNDDEKLARLQKHFGYRLGKLQWIGRCQYFPLKLMHAKQQYKDNVVLIGNASHTIHPIAGQGFNLGLRDVATLAELIHQHKTNFETADVMSLLKTYSKHRRPDQQQIIHFTDNLINIFCHELIPIKALRNLGLVGLDLLPFSKHMITKKAMGFNVMLPNLALGIPL